MNIIGDILEPVCTSFGDAINYGARSIIKGFCALFNTLVDKACEFFTQTPWEFAGGETWSLVMTCNTVFVSIAVSLMCVFWLIGFLGETTDIKQELRLEQLVKIFIKLFVAEFFVCHSLEIVCWFFSSATAICHAIMGADIRIGIDYAGDIRPVLELLNSDTNPNIKGVTSIANNLILVILAFIFAFMLAAIGISIFMAAVKRFLKILVLIPYGSLAASTLAGNHTIQRTAEGFYRYAIASALEVVTMILMLAVGSALLTNTGILESMTGPSPSGSEGAGNILIYIIAFLALKAVLLGCISSGIKQAEGITQRIVG